MEWIGILTVGMLLFCLWSGIQTGRRGWFVGFVWCIPLLLQVMEKTKPKEVNGLVTLLSLIMIGISIFPLFRVKIWNTKKRNVITLMEGTMFIFMMLQTGYCIFQLPQLNFLHGFLWEYKPGSGNFTLFVIVIKIWLLLTGMSFLSIWMTKAWIGAVDRFFSKKEEFTILRCRAFPLRILRRFYYLEGIHNGVTMHFQMISPMYFILKGQKTITLSLTRGCLGGLYCTKIPPYEVPKRKMKRKWIRKGIGFLFWIFASIVVYYFLQKVCYR